jgi:hypothetical protein
VAVDEIDGPRDQAGRRLVIHASRFKRLQGPADLGEIAPQLGIAGELRLEIASLGIFQGAE